MSGILINPYRFTSGSSPVAVSDTFARADNASLGASWTEEQNQMEIFADSCCNTTAAGACVSSYNTPLSTVFQYGKVQLRTVDGAGGLIFRFVDISSPYYHVWSNGFNGLVEWDTVGGGGGSNQTASLSFAEFDYLAVVVSGTGTSTEVLVWKNPTGDAPDTGGATWGGAGPTVSAFTNNPSVACDTGLKVGVKIYGNSALDRRLRNWFAGDVT